MKDVRCDIGVLYCSCTKACDDVSFILASCAQELAGLAKVGVQPDTLAGTALVKACCRDMTLAQSVFDELFGESDKCQ